MFSILVQKYQLKAVLILYKEKFFFEHQLNLHMILYTFLNPTAKTRLHSKLTVHSDNENETITIFTKLSIIWIQVIQFVIIMTDFRGTCQETDLVQYPFIYKM